MKSSNKIFSQIFYFLSGGGTVDACIVRKSLGPADLSFQDVMFIAYIWTCFPCQAPPREWWNPNKLNVCHRLCCQTMKWMESRGTGWTQDNISVFCPPRLWSFCHGLCRVTHVLPCHVQNVVWPVGADYHWLAVFRYRKWFHALIWSATVRSAHILGLGRLCRVIYIWATHQPHHPIGEATYSQQYVCWRPPTAFHVSFSINIVPREHQRM